MIVAVGALGGSGTRVVAEILIKLGIFIGNDLNVPNDNLLYTRLFKNVDWYKNSTPRDRDLRHLIFEKCMNGIPLTFKEKIELFKASKSNVFQKNSINYYRNIFFRNQFQSNKSNSNWGWKEPNSHIYMKDIHRSFKEIKYIYVIRHGLDMAFSKNIQQLTNWGFLHNITMHPSDVKSELAEKQLDYWIKSSENALLLGEKLFKNNFYVLNYQKLITNPFDEIKNLISFLGMQTSEELLNEVVKLPKVPKTEKRYKNEDLTIFSKAQIEKVKSFGFTI